MSNRTYLSVDIGTSQTRVCLFDNQRGPFELRSRAQSATTLQVGRDVRSGFIAAVEKLESQTGRPLLDNRKHLMMSESGEAWGVSGAGLTFSAGVPIRTIIIGASEAYSLPALRRLVSFFDCEIVLEINLQQTLNETAQLEAMLAAMKDSFPMFRRYFKAKARLLGKEQLPWWDLFAAVGRADTYTWPQSCDFVLEHFAVFSPDLAAWARRAPARRRSGA